MHTSKIVGVGKYVPERVVTNAELSTLMETSNEWIIERTGIQQRRYAKPGVDTTSNMGAKAAENAIKQAGIDKKDIDFIVFATLSPDYYFPGCGVLIQKQLGLDTIGAIDIKNQCSGFIYALSVADQFIKTGMYKTILVVASELQSNGLNFSNEGRDVAVIFGDGAGAVILQRSPDESGILSTHLHAQGEFAEELILEEPGTRGEKRIMLEKISQGIGIYPKMNGRNVFKHAVTRMSESVIEALNHNKLDKKDISLLIAHQANLRIADAVKHQFELSDHQVFNNIQKYGNTTAASIPIALCEALEEGKLKKGNLLCLVAFGSGFAWGSALIKW